MDDGWKFAESLLGITAEALKQRKEALSRAELAKDEAWKQGHASGKKTGMDIAADRLRDILFKCEQQPGWGIDELLAEADRRLNRGAPPLGNPPPFIVHDFGWALAQMRAGKKVRRKAFIPVAHYRLEGPYVMNHMSCDQHLLPWSDLLATDWEVVP